MSFSSSLFDAEPIINDDGMANTAEPPGCKRGLDLSARGPGEYEYGAAADPFPAEWLVPRHEWQARIQEMEERKSRLSDICTLANLPYQDQNGLNYCWIASPAYALRVMRCLQNQPDIALSHASGGAQIKNFRNVGGWGKEALEWIASKGLNADSDWPANSLNKKYLTAENKAKALLNRVVEWNELAPRNIDQAVSVLFRRMPLPAGFNWWSHEVTLIDPVWLDGDIAFRFRNQWQGYGVNGYGIIQGSRMRFDDGVTPRTAYAS